MRLFIAVELPSETRDSLIEAQAALKQRVDGRVSWVGQANLHLTLKFLGEVAEAEVMRLCDALTSVSVPRFSISISRLGALPPRGPARVLMAEVAGQTDALATLNEAIERACEPLGFAREKRKYHPHITLARIRTPRRLSREIEEVKIKPSQPFEVGEFVLIQSRLNSAGSEYTCVFRFQMPDR